MGIKTEKQLRRKEGRKRVDSPEEDRLSLSDGDIVHHFVVGLRIPLAADRQPCRQKKHNPQREKNCAFGKSDKVSPERHHIVFSLLQVEEKKKKKIPQRDNESLLFVPWIIYPRFIRLNPNLAR